LDEIENLEAQISYLQEDIGQRLHLLNEDQSTEQFKQSTPKPVDSETERSDSGIVTTRSQKSHQTAQSRTEGIVENECRQQTTPFACAVIISQLYTSVVTFNFLVLLDIIRKCYFSSLWHTTGLHNWGHDIIFTIRPPGTLC
jgi:hypothetical protein